MAVIEHRTVEGVLGAFQSSGMTKCAIWHMTTPIMVYDGDDQQAAEDQLSDWLSFIVDGGTTAVYTLKVYPDAAKDITNKTAFRAATRFQLTAAQGADYKNTPDGRVMVIRDGQRPAGNMGGNNSQLQALLDNQNKLMELIAKNMQAKEADRLDKLIGYLEETSRKPPDESTEDKLLKLGQFLIDKPEIIDKVGYIFRPSLYSREPAQQPINGTEQVKDPEPEKAAPMAEQTNTQEAELTEEQEHALEERMNTAMDKVEGIIGLEQLTLIMETLAAQPDTKISKLTPDKLKSAFAFL